MITWTSPPGAFQRVGLRPNSDAAEAGLAVAHESGVPLTIGPGRRLVETIEDGAGGLVRRRQCCFTYMNIAHVGVQHRFGRARLGQLLSPVVQLEGRS
ncbi:hypothetical protein [Streptomyces caeruleatus]|uniref:Uncharacterized protein n=1 Tax=Streptomyces caeruleatus TaxID=661399 RepID=A0A101TQU8_9ACTN|nr:hypothetical protein [Streptomyces caeruleatus]KUN96774.1 hypothetical protein AQJ67_31835 [Streptomyces caeruleatus]